MTEKTQFLYDEAFPAKGESFSYEDAFPEVTPERNIIGDIGSRLARGVASTVELAGHALDTMGADTVGQKLVQTAEGWQENVDFLKPDASEVAGEGFVKKGVMEGVESSVPSLTGGMGGAAFGAGVGSVVPGVGTVVGGLVGAAAGALGLFGAGIYGREKAAALKAGKSEEEAHRHGLEQGVIEGGIEFIATPIELLTGGFGKVATQPLKSTIKDLLKTPIKTMAKNYGKTMGVETSTEMLQSGLSNEYASDHGLADGTNTEAVLESIIPAMTMSLMFGMGTQALNSAHKRQVKKALTDQNVAVQNRNAAVDEVYSQILPEDAELADAWKAMATDKIGRGEAIDIDEDYTNYAVKKKTLEKGSDEGGADDALQGVAASPDPGAGAVIPDASKGVLSKVAAKSVVQENEKAAIVGVAPDAAAVDLQGSTALEMQNAGPRPEGAEWYQGRWVYPRDKPMPEASPEDAAQAVQVGQAPVAIDAKGPINLIAEEYGDDVAEVVRKARTAKQDITIDQAVAQVSEARNAGEAAKEQELAERRSLKLTPREAMTVKYMRDEGTALVPRDEKEKQVFESLAGKGVVAFDEAGGGYSALPLGQAVPVKQASPDAKRKEGSALENGETPRQVKIPSGAPAGEVIQQHDSGVEARIGDEVKITEISAQYGRKVASEVRKARLNKEKITFSEAIARAAGKDIPRGEKDAIKENKEGNSGVVQGAPESGKDGKGQRGTVGVGESSVIGGDGEGQPAGKMRGTVGMEPPPTDGDSLLRGPREQPIGNDEPQPVGVREQSVDRDNREPQLPGKAQPSGEPQLRAVDQPAKEPLVEHKTKKGKVIKGVVRKDLTKEQAEKIGPYAFKKDGGFFIREKHLVNHPGAETGQTSDVSIPAEKNESKEQESTGEGLEKTADIQKATERTAKQTAEQIPPSISAKSEKVKDSGEVTFVIRSLQTGKKEELTVKDGKQKKSPDGELTPEPGNNIVAETGEKNNADIRADGDRVPGAEQSAGTAKAEGRKQTDRVPEGRGGSVRRPGDGDNSGDVQQPAERNDVQDAEPRPGKKGGKRADDAGSDRVPVQPVNYHITAADKLGSGGATTKARENIKAIRILKTLQKENRPATQEEQAALVRYVGWGASELANGIFPQKKWSYEKRAYKESYKDGWASLGADLQKLLSKEEYEAAKRSTLNAHYTSEEVIKGMYKALARFGYQGSGRAIEPGSGVGHFIGLLPDELSGTRFTTVEMDPISAGIAKALYPGHDIHNLDYAKFKAPNNFFDIAIGNPPFDQTPVESDPDYAAHKFALHDFFFAKTIDKVRPGGFMILVTSRYTMDKANDKARSYLSKRADLLGAIRLPQTAFKKNAGTEVVTDVLFLQKREPGTKAGGAAWGTLNEVQGKDKDGKDHTFFVNEYFAEHPEMVLGRHAAEGSMYGAGEYTVIPKSGEIGEHFAKAVETLPKDIYQQAEKPAGDAAVAEIDFAPSTIKEGGYFTDDKGNILQKEEGVGKPVAANGPKKQLIADFISLRDKVKQVLYVQLKGEGSLQDAQRELAEAYSAFVASHGPINKAVKVTRKLDDGTESVSYRYPNFQVIKSDPDAYRVAAIERYDLDSGKTEKADIFTKRVIDQEVEPKVESLTDALHVTMYQTGKVDIAKIAALMEVSEQEAIDGLGPAIYFDQNGRKWVTADEYLSGPVREKLVNARAAAKLDPLFERNVTALAAAQPADLPPSKIGVTLGMPILEPAHIEDFAREVIDMGVRVSYLPQDGSWSVTAVSGHQAAGAVSDYGTGKRGADRLLDDALNGRSVKLFHPPDSDGKREFDRDGTEAANAKLQKIKDRFKTWVWEDAARTELLARKFNDHYNNTVPREYGGEHIRVMTFPGMSRAVVPFEHQKRVAWRIVQNGNTYMAHSVGAGKTIGSILAGMEQKRLGIKKKPMWVVPNHMLMQFSGEFLELYPAAKLLVADEGQFSKENRNRFMGKIAAENWDGIIITHSAFGKIPMSADFQAQFIEEQLDDLEIVLSDAKGDYAKTKQVERLKKRLEGRLEKILAAKGKDTGISFEETGIDQLFVDEAHEFRKLDFTTNQTSISGIDSAGSLKSFDLYTKIRHLESLSPGRSTVLMSGTPLTNTMGEIYTLQRYLQEDKLRQLGLHHFDSWAATFGDMVTNLDVTPAGTYKPVTRFAKFKNMPSLVSMWAEIGDAVHARDLHYLTRPKVKGGGRKLVVANASPLQLQYKKVLGERIKTIEARKRPPQKGDDIILSVITDGRHAALDDRFIDRNVKPAADSKTEMLLGNVFSIWEKSKAQRSTQMIFCDSGLPGMTEKRGFSVYSNIKAELIRRGVPENEIAFMQDYKKSDEKIKLFKAMNKGEVRVLIGSSQAMGTGVNAQKKLLALHHYDPDSYLPANIEQREGRIVRQRNENAEVEIYAYVTKGSYDEQMWQFLETKQRFIDQFLSGKVSEDSTDDIDGSADSFAEARALSSDNPLAIEMAGVQNELGRLEALNRAHIDDQRSLAFRKGQAEYWNKEYAKSIGQLEGAIARRVDTKGKQFTVKVDGREYSDREKGGAALVERLVSLVNGKEMYHEKIKVGELAGFGLWAWEKEIQDEVRVGVAIIDGKSKFQVADFTPATVDELQASSKSGLMMQMENSVRRLDSKLEEVRESIAKNEKTIEDAAHRIGQPFEHAAALEEKRKRLEAIKEELAGQGKAAAPGAVEAGGESLAGQESLIVPQAEPASFVDVLSQAKKANEILPWLAEHAENDSYRAIAERISGQVGEDVELVIVKPGEKVEGGVPTLLNMAHGVYYTDNKNGRKAIFIRHTDFGDEHGMTEKTVLHELLHAATLEKIKEGNLVKNRGTATFEAVQELYSLQKDVVRHLDEKSAAGTLNEYEKQLAVQMAASDVKELVSWGLTDKKFQKMLAGIEVKKKSGFTRFVESLLKLLGLEKTDLNALSELIRITDNIIAGEQGRQASEANFAKWFGKSKVDKVVYHGSPTFGLNNNFTFDPDRTNAEAKTQSPGRGLGTFFTENETEALGYAGAAGSVEKIRLRIENPLEINSWDIPQFKSVEDARAFRKRKQLQGHDGIHIVDEGHWVIFEAGQAKSVDKNSGEYSTEDPEILAHAILTKQGQTEQDFRQATNEARELVAAHEKKDSSFLHRIFSTPEYYFGKFSAAAGRVVEHALKKNDLKFEHQARLFHDNGRDIDFVKAGEAFAKEKPAEYKEADDYLVEVGRTYEGFSVEKAGKVWKVTAPDGEFVTEGDTDTAKTFESEKEARAAMINFEKEYVLEMGLSEAAAEYIAMFRRVSIRGFDMLAAEMQKIDEERVKAGLPELKMMTPGAEDHLRWGLFEKGKKVPVVRYASEAEAMESLENASKLVSFMVYAKKGKGGKLTFKRAFANQLAAQRYARRIMGEVQEKKRFGSLTMRRLSDAELRPKTLQEMVAEMGDLIGVYFPRMRKSGAYVLKAFKKDHDPFRQNFDLPFADPEKAGSKPGLLVRRLINRGTPIGRKIAELQKAGYTVEVTKDESVGEDVFEASKLSASLEAILSQTFIGQEKANEAQLKASQIVNQLLTLQVADIIKGRGFLSSRMRRAEQHWEGYETDANVALTTYVQGLAGGMAKRETAKNMVLAMSGKDYSWQDYKNEVENPVYEDWEQIVNERRVDPGKQKNLWKDTRDLVVEVLRNDEQIDRIMGTLRGLAVIKFLGFRVSSAAVNLTNMVLGVPATISSFSKLGLPGTMRMIAVSSLRYAEMLGKKKLNSEDKDVFDYIRTKGWDAAQFNMEAAQMLRSKLGRKWDKFADVAMMMFGAVERANRAITIHAAFKALKSKSEWAAGGSVPGPAFDRLMAEAHHISNRAHGIYNKATAPKWTQGQGNPMKLFYTFQKFSHSYLLNAMEMGFERKDYGNAAYLLLSPALLAGLGASMPLAVVMQLMQAFGIGGDDPEESFYAWVAEIFGSDALARQGITGAMGINIKGSLEMNFAVPTSLKDLAGAPGALVTDAVDAGAYLKEGEAWRALEKLLPTGLGAPIKAAREYGEGISTGSSSPVFYGDEPLKASGADALVRALSFNPARLSGIREKMWNEKEVAGKYEDMRSAIYKEYRKAYVINPEDRTAADEADLVAAVMDFNRLVATSGRPDLHPITGKSIRAMLKRAARPNMRERLRAAAEA